MNILQIENLSVEFRQSKNNFRAVDNLTFNLKRGEILGIVGESGCGKSVSSLALMGLLDQNAKLSAKTLKIDGHDLLKISPKEHSKLLGSHISMIFQDALGCLNPSYTIGFQIAETIRVHDKESSKAEIRAKCIDLLQKVGIPDPKNRLDAYPYQLSGGMCQRVMVAMAISCNPQILIADEPTTALDVTIQAQIMDLLLDLQEQSGMSMILISHDLALVSQSANRIIVMYAGRIVEEGYADEIFKKPRHPYTQALLNSLPGANRSRLKSLPGTVPGPYDRTQGCVLSPRCPYAVDKCRSCEPSYKFVNESRVLCHFGLDENGVCNDIGGDICVES